MLKTLILLKTYATDATPYNLSYTYASLKTTVTTFAYRWFFSMYHKPFSTLDFVNVQLRLHRTCLDSLWVDVLSIFLQLLTVFFVLKFWPTDCYAELCFSPFFRKAGQTFVSMLGAVGRVAIRLWTLPLTFCDARRWDLYEFYYMFSSFRVRRAVFLIVFWFNLLPLSVTALLLESVPYTQPILELLSTVGISWYQLNKVYASCFEVFKWLGIIYGIIFVGTAFSNQNTDQQAELRRWALKEPSDWGKFKRFVRKVWKWCRGK
jgi:hypothetical protein